MTTTAARVELLTAEVRVLMVGSRQVTLSVYGQLDTVKPGEIEPFGRVRPRAADPGWIYVVGCSARRADAGTLVRSARQSCASLVRQADRLRDRADMVAERNDPDPEIPRSRRWQLDAILADEKRTADELTEGAGRLMGAARDAAPWDRLPLIVLAGLR